MRASPTRTLGPAAFAIDRRWRTCKPCAALVALLTVNSLALPAQSTTYAYEVAVGVAVPTGILGRDRGAWPLVRIGVHKLEPTKRIHARLDGEVFSMPGRAARVTQTSPAGRLTSIGVALNGIMASKRKGIAPYGLAGIGVHWLANGTADAYSGGLMGLRVGAGIHATVGSFRIVAELASQAAILSTYGGVGNPKVGAYWPVSIGLRF